jgi:hypothetical protein
MRGEYSVDCRETHTDSSNRGSKEVMSGLEIAGLVLGALPPAVKAIQGYRETLSLIKNVKRDLDYLERDLETERIRFQDTCEALLVGIVPPIKINAMITDPFGPEWKFYAGQLVC